MRRRAREDAVTVVPFWDCRVQLWAEAIRSPLCNGLDFVQLLSFKTLKSRKEITCIAIANMCFFI